MKIRATMIIEGEVQEAGYRAFVIRNAQKLNLVGYVENLPDGTVKAVCEGEREAIEKLIGSIKVKTETVEVEDIKVSFEDYSGEFDGKGFIVRIKDTAQELFQGYATSAKYFKIGWDKQDKMLEQHDKMLDKQDKMLEQHDKMLDKQDKTLELQEKTLGKQDETLGAIRSMHSDLKDFKDSTIGSFGKLDERYGVFHETMVSMQKELISTRKELSRLVEYIGVLVKEHIEKGK